MVLVVLVAVLCVHQLLEAVAIAGSYSWIQDLAAVPLAAGF